ncbi:hypothetical protein TIFTF001_056625, partial [Ficus carica]
EQPRNLVGLDHRLESRPGLDRAHVEGELGLRVWAGITRAWLAAGTGIKGWAGSGLSHNNRGYACGRKERKRKREKKK